MSIRGEKILLFSHDPGGANTLIPLIQPLKSLGFDVLLYGKAIALEKYRQADLEGTRFDVDTPEEIAAFLKACQPACMITGTSANDFTEKYLWQAAQMLNIPNLAILDQWVNYGVRFSPYGVDEIETYQHDKTHPYLPDVIGVMDNFARQEMAQEGIPEDKILVTGQPYFKSVMDHYRHFDKQDVKARLGIPADEQVLLFVSEPLEVSYGSENYLGYTEKTILKSLLDVLGEIDEHLNQPMCLLLKQHAREQPQGLDGVLKNYQFNNIRIVLDTESLPGECLQVSDWVCGMSSMLLLEAALVGKPVLSIQIGLKQTNPLILCRQGSLVPILEQRALQSAFQSAFLGDTVTTDPVFTTPELELIENSLERILAWVVAQVPTSLKAI